MRNQFICLLILLASLSHTTWAQEDKGGVSVSKFYIETRLAGQGYWTDGNVQDEQSGFKGQFINIRLDGQITKGLTYSYRQRLNKNSDQTFWDATDWLYLNYACNKHWEVAAGKQVYSIGGFEYDRAPIDLYYCSEFWNNIPCYQIGVSAAYKPSEKDKFSLQIANTPFRKQTGNNHYGVNLTWNGKHGCWETIWSINMMQNIHRQWMNYIALGNRFHIGNLVHVDIDVMNRAADHQTFLFKDWSVMTELSVQPCKSTRCWLGYTHDANDSGTDADYLVCDGTRLNQISLGTEVNPIKKYRDGLRAFAVAGYSWGNNTNPDGTLQDKQLKVQAGIKFQLDILQGIKSIIDKHKNH